MKKLMFLSVVIAMLFFSCKKEESDVQNENQTPTPVTHTSSLSCKVDGQSFTAADVSIYWVSSGATNKIGCEGTDAAGNTLSLAVNATIPGSYTVYGANTDHFMDFEYKPSGSQTFFIFGSEDTALVSFTQIDHYDQTGMEISGTFSFSVTRTPDHKSITEGVFSYVHW